MTSIAARLLAELDGRPVSVLPDAMRHVLGAARAEVLLIDHQCVSFQALTEPGVPREDGLWRAVLADEEPRVDGNRLVVAVVAYGDPIGVLDIEWTAKPDDDAVAVVRHELAPLVALRITAAAPTSYLVARAQRRREMALAAAVQRSVLPPSGYADDRIAVEGAVEPAYETGGDIFDYSLRDTLVSATVLDAMGHGLAAALVSVLASAALREARLAGGGMAEQFDAVSEAVAGQYGDDTYVGGVSVELEPATGRLRWLTAGHEAPLVGRAGGALEALPVVPALPLGVVLGNDDRPRSVQETMLAPGDLVILYSDGAVDNLDGDGSAVGLARFQELLASELHRPGRLAVRRVLDRLMELTGPDLRDDATVLVLRRLAG